MKPHHLISCFLSGLPAIMAIGKASGQSAISFDTRAAFVDPVPQQQGNPLIADNDLTDGHRPEIDLTDAPSGLAPSGPAGSAAFQWGEAADFSSYPHASAAWFEPLLVSESTLGEAFELGAIYYRNGTILHATGANWVDIRFDLGFPPGSGNASGTVTYGLELINTPNGDDPVASADIIALRPSPAPLYYWDTNGARHVLQLGFRTDTDTADGSLASPDEFRVFEGVQGQAVLIGTFVPSLVPEPSGVLLTAIGLAAGLRRRR